VDSSLMAPLELASLNVFWPTSLEIQAPV
jgi:hypothetical protein